MISQPRSSDLQKTKKRSQELQKTCFQSLEAATSKEKKGPGALKTMFPEPRSSDFIKKQKKCLKVHEQLLQNSSKLSCLQNV